MRKLLLLLTVASGILTTGTTVSYPYMLIRQHDGTERSISSEGLRFTVNKGQLSVTSAIESLTVELSELASMAFSAEPAYIDSMEADRDTTSIEIFTVDGLYVGRTEPGQQAGDIVPATSIYILKSNNGSEKTLITK
ncbi:MAG: hypothetical protein K2J24_09030 [Muribaculaceae bacterium]|nr:hypothetical protein [Muribaculaceae bacterium]